MAVKAEPPEFATSSRTDLIAVVLELRDSLARERQRAAMLERAVDVERAGARRAWTLAALGAVR
jgi:hypothetical protein